MIDISKGRYWDKPCSIVDGCTPCSPGCEHCWSAAMTHRFSKDRMIGPGYDDSLTYATGGFTGKILTHPDRLSIPLKRKKPTVYAVWNDWCHESVGDAFRHTILSVATGCEQHTFLALTKREKVLLSFANQAPDIWPDNVWSGLTVCNQDEADEKIPFFLQVPGRKFLSIEPMLGAISLSKCWICKPEEIGGCFCENEFQSSILAVILGGETGPGARPLHPDWVRSVRDQCQSAGVPFFLKFLNKKDGRVLDGKTYDELPWRNYAI